VTRNLSRTCHHFPPSSRLQIPRYARNDKGGQGARNDTGGAIKNLNREVAKDAKKKVFVPFFASLSERSERAVQKY
jgi:3D (Asp-Asp-Asp) domain-containing protein